MARHERRGTVEYAAKLNTVESDDGLKSPSSRLGLLAAFNKFVAAATPDIALLS